MTSRLSIRSELQFHSRGLKTESRRSTGLNAELYNPTQLLVCDQPDSLSCVLVQFQAIAGHPVTDSNNTAVHFSLFRGFMCWRVLLCYLRIGVNSETMTSSNVLQQRVYTLQPRCGRIATNGKAWTRAWSTTQSDSDVDIFRLTGATSSVFSV